MIGYRERPLAEARQDGSPVLMRRGETYIAARWEAEAWREVVTGLPIEPPPTHWLQRVREVAA